MLRWTDFENTSQNYTADFEDMCRIFFKYHYLNDAEAIINQKTNNPGIETEPYLIDNKRMGFQAKYFSNNISYSDILDSAEKIVKYSNGQIDKVILFCNKNIDETTKKYIETKHLLANNNIEIELCCNKNILDPINTIEKYAQIKALFFNEITLSNDWFKDKLESSLIELGPRYLPDVHVDVPETQKHFDILFKNEKVAVYLDEVIEKTLNDLNYIYYSKELVNKMKSIISGFKTPNRHHYEEILKWFSQFENIQREIDTQKKAIETSIALAYEDRDKYKKENVDKLYRTLQQINNLDGIINRFNFAEDEHFKHIKNKVLIVEGDGGMGKSHLLAHEAKLNGVLDKNRVVLLLGQKFVFEDTPQVQIMKCLDLNATFQDFLSACEAKGELDGNITFIMIDAINECLKYDIWKHYINDIIDKIEKLKFVRLVCSFRTTYKEYILSEKLQEKIKLDEITLINVKGFKYNLAKAIPKFFNHYGIPMTTSAFFNLEFENPLFLLTYCEAYEKGDVLGGRGIFSLFNDYLEKEEKKQKLLNNITRKISYTQSIVSKIGNLMFNSNKNHYFMLSDLYDKCSGIPDCEQFIDAFIDAKIFITYKYDDGDRVCINYERFSDYIIAKHIIESFNNYEDLCLWIKTSLLKTDEYGNFVRFSVEGQFAALSLLAREKYHREIIECLSGLKNDEKIKIFGLRNLIIEYLDSFVYRGNSDIDAVDFNNKILPYIDEVGASEKFLDVLINLTGRECSMNIDYVTKLLMHMNLSVRDYLWTMYINNRFNNGDTIYYIVQYFLNESLDKIANKDRLTYSQLLTWFLSSSNRKLRDNSSRALIRLLGADIDAMVNLLKIFKNVNDPYIYSRLYGCVYGALLIADSQQLQQEKLMILCNHIYDNVFNQEIVYPDILLRDYALNIIEYCNSLKVKLDFNIEKCNPPYKSFSIPNIELKSLCELYQDTKGWSGKSAIKYSMAPDYDMEKFTCSYGDFGRYIFQSSLEHFKNVDIKKVFCYAYNYIIKSLGYDNKLFSEYDERLRYKRDRNIYPIERIGKKYEWIAMYHVLALVSDSHILDNEHIDISVEYKGTWYPCVRDFDPTLTICNNKKPHKKLEIALNINKYDNWQVTNDDWVEINDINSCKDLTHIKDNNGDTWYALYYSVSDKSSKDYSSTYQSVWLRLMACFIKKSEFKKFIEKIANVDIYNDCIRQTEIKSRYSVFAREYSWSPAYLDEYGEESFTNLESIIGYEDKKTFLPRIYFSDIPLEDIDDEKIKDLDDADMEIKEEITIKKQPIYGSIGSISPCCQEYLWEEQYDFSKDETIRINMPSALIVNQLKLKQSIDGVWERNGEIVCADFSLIDGSNVDGVYIKEKYLQELLANDLAIVWIGIGEKQHIYKDNYNADKSWRKISSLIYFDENKELQEKFDSQIISKKK